MIKAYMVGISSHYEGEDIEVRYSIFEDEELVSKESVHKRYVKPAIVSHVALITLLKDLEKYKGKEIMIVINDAALEEQIRGVNQTKNQDVLRKLKNTKSELAKFNDTIIIKDASKDKIELAKWNEILQP